MLLFFLFYCIFLLYNIAVVFAIHSHESAMGEHVLPILNPSPTSIPQGHPSAPALSTLSCIKPGLVIYFTYDNIHVSILFPQSSHPRLLPQSAKVCSLHLCLFRCLAYRIIIAIFLNSIYMHVNLLYWCYSF